MTHHIAVGEVDSQARILAALQRVDQRIGDQRALHPGALLEGNDVGGDLHVGFQLVGELAGLVAVPEVGYVTVFLGFGDSVLCYARVRQILTHSIGDLRGIHQITGGNVQIAVVFQHAGIGYLGSAYAVELVEVRACLKGLGDLNGTVAAEIEEYDAVAILNGAHRLTVFGDNKGRQILVDDLGLGTVGFDGFLGGGKLSALTQNVGLPTQLYHRPVGLVAVHGDLHTSAAGGDLDIKGAVPHRRDECLKGLHVIQSGGFTYVTAVQQNVDAYLGYAVLFGTDQHCLQMIDVGVDVTVGEQTEEVEGAAVLYVGNDLLPSGGDKHLAGLNRLGYQLRTLCENLTGAQGVVTNLGVTHIVIGGQTDSGAVCLQLYGGIRSHYALQIGHIGAGYGVGFALSSETDTIHNDGEYRTLYAGECGFFQFAHRGNLLKSK